VLLSGILGTARLHLGAHQPSQVAVGYFGGFFVAMLAIMYL
jgi:membrane-associated phospholipid phosphatase